RYFSHKGITEEKQVERILFNIDETTVRAWVRENEKELKGLTFAVFMARLRGIVLSTEWDWEVAQTLSKKQGEGEGFMSWVNTLREANDILAAVPRFHIPSNKLRDHILLHCHDDVRREYSLGNKDCCYDGIEDFHKWLQTVADIDTVITARKNQISKYIASSIAASAKTHLKNITNVKSANTAGTTGGEKDKGKGSGGGTPKSNVTARVHVYPLTAEERGLLNEHSGCYQCRRVYVDHRAANCLEKGKALTLEEYNARRLTPEMAATAQVAFAKKSKAAGGAGGGSVTIAAVFEELSDDDEGSDAGSEYVFPRHMTLSCLVSAPSIAPTAVKRALIDTGAPPAMISLTLVNKLGLQTRKLSRPLEVSGVFSNGTKESVRYR
ncbi:hypothetical protein C0992_009233, partial [Termitomyces sp. T32_za158]